MKTINKVIAMSLAAMTSVSAMSLNVFAEQITPLPGGGEFVIYEEGDELPMDAYVRTAGFNFNQTFPKYPSSATLITPYTENSINNVIPLGRDEKNIMFHFNSAPDGCYVWMYNVTTGSYELDGASMGAMTSKNYSFRNLPAGNTYRFRFSGPSSSTKTLSGSCETY